jgi:serine O-acetyltransferase
MKQLNRGNSKCRWEAPMDLVKKNVHTDYPYDMQTIITDIIENYRQDKSIDFINRTLLPLKKNIISILYKLLEIIFPGYFADHNLNESTINYKIGNELVNLFDAMVVEVEKSLGHTGHFEGEYADKKALHKESAEIVLEFFRSVPQMRSLLLKDVEAAYYGDPAAKSISEVILSYPGIFAISCHRIAHFFYKKNVPLVTRIISEYAHSKTGIDIHPGAVIGQFFFIDHGTGVVIGETCEIGNNVKLYQGVTLGALSFPRDSIGDIIKGLKRHPTIEDNVTIYAGATILGGETVIGANSIIGGNVCIVSSVPCNSKATLDFSELKIQITENKSCAKVEK